MYSARNGICHAFRMHVPDIKIVTGNNVYSPTSVDPDAGMTHGTRIVLSNLRRTGNHPKSLKKRLARRFNIIGDTYGFEIKVNGEKVTMKDREYRQNLQYAWVFGERGRAEVGEGEAPSTHELSPAVQVGDDKESIDGWIGTVGESEQMMDSETRESLNRIVIMVRGKMAQEDILETFGEGGIYSKYVMGEIHADFLDKDDCVDIATTSRQRIIEEDPRYVTLREKIRQDLKEVQKEWTGLRNEEGEKAALTIPAINDWYEELPDDLWRAAKKLFGRINQYPIESEDSRRRLFHRMHTCVRESEV